MVLVCGTRDAFAVECFGFRSRFDEQGGGRIAVKVRSKVVDGALEHFALEEMGCERVLHRYRKTARIRIVGWLRCVRVCGGRVRGQLKHAG